MSKWKDTVFDDIYDSYEEAFDDFCENLSPYEVFDYILNTAREGDIVAALNGKKPDFYTYKLMELADKQCTDSLVEILDEEEENTEED